MERKQSSQSPTNKMHQINLIEVKPITPKFRRYRATKRGPVQSDGIQLELVVQPDGSRAFTLPYEVPALWFNPSNIQDAF
jgi:hypothetical protein